MYRRKLNAWTHYRLSYSFYLGDQAYLLVADLKLLKELMNNATEHFSASNEVSAMCPYIVMVY